MDAQRCVAFLPGVQLTLKSLRKKDFDTPLQTLPDHLRKRRSELGLSQRKTAARMGVDYWTYLNWERGRTQPVTAQFRPVIEFLGYDPSPPPATLRERLQAKRRALGVTLEQVAKYLKWDPDSLTSYLDGSWRLPADRAVALDAFLGLDILAAAPVHAMPRRCRRTMR